MKGGRTAPRNGVRWETDLIDESASMKGGRTAPRNKLYPAFFYPPLICFNEGGADCPPKLLPLD